MRIVVVLSFIVLSVVSALAQSVAAPQHPPGMSILKAEVVLVSGPSMPLDIDRLPVAPRAEDRVTEGQVGVHPPPSAFGLRTRRKATLVLRNESGAKAVRAVEWDFIHVRETEQGVALRYRVHSRVSIKAGETKRLVKSVVVPSGGCIHILCGSTGVRAQVKSTAGKCLEVVVAVGWDREQVALKRIEYSDGGVWERR